MTVCAATICWKRDAEADFRRGQYSRAHHWDFDGGASIRASASPAIVPVPWSDPVGVDPEEAFIAALSSCHMLFFVDFARRAGHLLDSYVDQAEGMLEVGGDGRIALTHVRLRPQLVWGSIAPSETVVADLHRRAHEACFIANSVKTKVTIDQ